MTADQLRAKKPAIFLMGATATGKTDLAIELRKHLPLEIISVDSALVYRGMDIGTAKPEAGILAEVPHRMIDICDPAESFTVADFVKRARQDMVEISAQERIPILVGGTMLYYRALLDGLADIPAVDPAIRQAIEQQAESEGWPVLHQALSDVDPETAAQIHPNHSRRIQRALEVYRGTGKPISYYRKQQALQPGMLGSVTSEYQITQIALMPEHRASLHARIADRFDRMLEQGFEKEATVLFKRGDLVPELPSMSSVGYRQMWRYLNGDVDRQQMIDQGVAATRQLAKRQLTWLRKWDELNCISIDKQSGELKIKQQLLDEALKILSKATI